MSQPLERITSVQNAVVKQATELHRTQARNNQQLVLIEGQHPIEEALAAGGTLKVLFVAGHQALPTSLSHLTIPMYDCTNAVMQKIATTKTPLPIIAVAEKPKMLPVNNSANTTVLALYQLQDPANLGALMRSAVAFGVTQLALIGPSVDCYHPKVIRASAGLGFRLHLNYFETVDEFLKHYQATHQVIALDVSAQQSLYDFKAKQPVVVLMGSEGNGLPSEVLTQTTPVLIPMASQAESLNVAIAGSIVLSQLFQK